MRDHLGDKEFIEQIGTTNEGGDQLSRRRENSQEEKGLFIASDFAEDLNLRS